MAVDAGQASVLLLFKRGATLQGADLGAEGRIPPHDGNGPVHLAFAIRQEELSGWESHLREHGRGAGSGLPDGRSRELCLSRTAVWKVRRDVTPARA